MRWRILGVIAAIGAAGMGISACGTPVVEGQTRLVAVTGTVTVNGKAAVADATLSAGDVVAVEGDGAARVRFSDGSTVLVFRDEERGRPGSLTIGGSRVAAEATTMLLKLGSGVCAFLVPPDRADKKTRFEIEGSSSITAIHGTEGKVAVVEGGDVVALKEGEVEVRALGGKEAVRLSAGQTVRVPAGQAPGTPEAYNHLLPSEKRFFPPPGAPDVKTFDLKNR